VITKYSDRWETFQTRTFQISEGTMLRIRHSFSKNESYDEHIGYLCMNSLFIKGHMAGCFQKKPIWCLIEQRIKCTVL